ncbi:hypothetical protein [Demequina sp. NBRC 110054]|uniref:hypothetical protein n=1 Tax=Demequina sp. NBRC 110054 TaxID=1570343 RepID=UPI001177DE45|nr:hypothetical protein [Demequina sp. NBRC 110054]
MRLARPGSLLAAMGKRERVAFIAAFAAWLALTAWSLSTGSHRAVVPSLLLTTVQLAIPAYGLIRMWQLRHTMGEARETARRARRASRDSASRP